MTSPVLSPAHNRDGPSRCTIELRVPRIVVLSEDGLVSFSAWIRFPRTSSGVIVRPVIMEPQPDAIMLIKIGLGIVVLVGGWGVVEDVVVVAVTGGVIVVVETAMVWCRRLVLMVVGFKI